MTTNRLVSILAAIIFVGGCVGSFFFGRATKSTSIVSTEIERDTIIVRDTITESYPVEVEREVVRTEYKYLTRVERDTITLRDTILVELPIEEREYKGNDYHAIVGGYNPYLKSIEVYPTTKIVTTTETRVVQQPLKWIRPYVSALAGKDVLGIGGGVMIKERVSLGAKYMRFNNKDVVGAEINVFF